MFIGKYDVESLNDGRYSIRWKDISGNYQKHIVNDLEDKLERILKSDSKYNDTQKVIQHYITYCTNPVEFLLATDNYFVEQMQDKWCYDQESFVENIIDFVQAYNKTNNTMVTHPEVILAVAHLENDWKTTWHSQPEMERLIESGFLKISVEP